MSETTSAEPREFDALDGPGGVNDPSGCTDTPEAESAPQEAVERITDAEAAEWARLAAEATKGPWVVDPDGSIGAPMAGLACGEDGHPRLDCPECGILVCHTSVMPGKPDAAFIASARTAVPRLLAEREALRADLAEARATIARLNARAQVAEAALHELTTTTGRGKAPQVAREVWQRCEESHGLVCPTTRRARDFAARVEAENARLISDVAAGEASDGHHTHRELYAYRMAFHAHAASGWLHWGLFAVPVLGRQLDLDGHTPEVALDRALRALLADTDSAQAEGGE